MRRRRQLDALRTMSGSTVGQQAAGDVVRRDADGRTGLHYAAADDAHRYISLLLLAGADANAADSHGLTPLHFACERGPLSAAKTLLDSGADVDSVSDWGNTPRREATLRGCTGLTPGPTLPELSRALRPEKYTRSRAQHALGADQRRTGQRRRSRASRSPRRAHEYTWTFRPETWQRRLPDPRDGL